MRAAYLNHVYSYAMDKVSRVMCHMPLTDTTKEPCYLPQYTQKDGDADFTQTNQFNKLWGGKNKMCFKAAILDNLSLDYKQSNKSNINCDLVQSIA